ncbi:Cell division protein FtsH [Thermogutta terrifontis]|jgi:cell division protease FtsH|uniref:ATP-dependent zinc metalloprotease FtsH n=1 Tax=Thermogutta terrifontis TaxID=1331910 RepID=A0A286RI28_9BACT|nr:Cell division protein FtsH [Thermogutta terrifontis]
MMKSRIGEKAWYLIPNDLQRLRNLFSRDSGNRNDPNKGEQSPLGDKKARERRGPGGPAILWYLLIALAVSLLLAGLVRPTITEDIPYLELVRLIEQGSPEENPKAAIVVTKKVGNELYRIRYSGLRDLVVRPHEVVGTVTREILDPVSKRSKPEEVTFRSSRLGFENDNNALLQLLLNKGFRDVRGGEPPTFWEQYGPHIILLLVFVLLMLFLLRRMGGPGSAIAFGRSRSRLYAPEDVGVTFKDVAGIDEAVEEVKEVVEFLKNPQKFRALGGRIPKGVLLVGPPGTGKTLLAKAIAGEAGVPFFSLSGSDFVEMFVGVGAARVRDMFQQAQARAPCIVFIDELDALGKMRGTSIVGGHEEREQTLNALLVEMDGFNSNSGVIVLAATNRPETLDPALLRPGRFDRHILVDRPDVRGREAILKVHCRNVKLDPSVNISEIAALTPGFVGADLANLVNEAALLAARKNKEAVTMEEFTEAVERVTAGLEKRQRVMSEEEKLRVAYHESGHALVAYSLPNTDPVHKVSIIPRGIAGLGYTLQRPEGDRYLLTQSELEARIQVLLAGSVAEELVFQDVSTGAQNDLQRATDIARSMVTEFGMSRLGKLAFRDDVPTHLGVYSDLGRPRWYSEATAEEIDREIRRIIDEALQRTRRILEVRRPALEALAQRLMQKEVIDQEELREIVETHSPGPFVVPGTEDVKPKRVMPTSVTERANNEAPEAESEASS